MISLIVVFYLFVLLFGIIGSMRGWGKEMLVAFSVILALAFINVIENFVPVLSSFVVSNPKLQFWLRVGAVVLISFFGYQTPKFSRISKAVEKRDRIQDVLLGLIMGFVSGYMIVGTIWYFVAAAGYYPLQNYVAQPATQQMADTINHTLKILPPVWLGTVPNVYIALVLGAIFVIVIFV